MMSRSAQAAEPGKILDILGREQIFAGGERRCVDRGDFREQRVIERVAWLLEPTQPEGRERLGISQRLVAGEFGIGVDRNGVGRSHDFEHRLDAPHVLRKRQAADLHFHHGVAVAEVPAHLLLQVGDGLPRPVPAAAHVTKHLVGGLAAVEAARQHPVQRLARDFRHRVPHRDLDRADRDRALAVAAGFLPLHHHRENLLRR